MCLEKMEIILAIATFLGGIVAIWFIYDKFFSSKPGDDIQDEGNLEKIIENKTVNSAWWESSELKSNLEAQGYNKFYWSDDDRVEERIDNGYDLIFDENNDKRIKYKLVNSSDQVLIGKKDT